MTRARLAIGFAAGFVSVLVFQNGLVAVLHAAGIIPFPAWQTVPVPPFGVPAILSAAFWGGLWGIAYALLEPWLTRHLRWWPGGLAFGAVLPVLVLLLVVLPLKGRPMGGGFGLGGLCVVVLLHACFGLGAAVFYRLGLRLSRKVATA